MESPDLGGRLGRYEIVKHLASGGMAELLLARVGGLEGFERHFAIKRIRTESQRDNAFVEMFLAEARLAAALHHHNIVQVHDIGEEDGIPYFAMEYVHGEDLRRVLTTLFSRGLQMPLEHVISIVESVAAGLHHAHEAVGPDRTPLGVVHRDVAPANILIGYDGNVKVVDFGIARAALRRTETQAGMLAGKAPYMAPEQCSGGTIDRRSDVFALGIVMFELLTTRRLFKGDNEFMTMSAVVDANVPAPSQLRPDIPPAVDAIVKKALMRHPAERYQSAEEMFLALHQVSIKLGLRSSAPGVAAYMKELFGQRVEPWLGDDNRPQITNPDFDGTLPGVAQPPDNAIDRTPQPSPNPNRPTPMNVARTAAMKPSMQPMSTASIAVAKLEAALNSGSGPTVRIPDQARTPTKERARTMQVPALTRMPARARTKTVQIPEQDLHIPVEQVDLEQSAATTIAEPIPPPSLPPPSLPLASRSPTMSVAALPLRAPAPAAPPPMPTVSRTATAKGTAPEISRAQPTDKAAAPPLKSTARVSPLAFSSPAVTPPSSTPTGAAKPLARITPVPAGMKPSGKIPSLTKPAAARDNAAGVETRGNEDDPIIDPPTPVPGAAPAIVWPASGSKSVPASRAKPLPTVNDTSVDKKANTLPARTGETLAAPVPKSVWNNPEVFEPDEPSVIVLSRSQLMAAVGEEEVFAESTSIDDAEPASRYTPPPLFHGYAAKAGSLGTHGSTGSYNITPMSTPTPTPTPLPLPAPFGEPTMPLYPQPAPQAFGYGPPQRGSQDRITPLPPPPMGPHGWPQRFDSDPAPLPPAPIGPTPQPWMVAAPTAVGPSMPARTKRILAGVVGILLLGVILAFATSGGDAKPVTATNVEPPPAPPIAVSPPVTEPVVPAKVEPPVVEPPVVEPPVVEPARRRAARRRHARHCRARGGEARRGEAGAEVAAEEGREDHQEGDAQERDDAGEDHREGDNSGEGDNDGEDNNRRQGADENTCQGDNEDAGENDSEDAGEDKDPRQDDDAQEDRLGFELAVPEEEVMRLLVLALFLPAVAFAQPAKSEVDQASDAFQAGDFPAALKHLNAAYNADPQPDLLYAIAQVEQKLDRCSDAIVHYEQFLATNPALSAQKDTREAIAVCKTKQATEPATPVTPTVAPQPLDTPGTPGPAAPTGPSPWYADALGLGLIGGGIVVGAIGAVVYADARSDLDAAETAIDHAAYEQFVDDAHGKRTASAVLMVGGGALIAGGVVRLMLRDRGGERPNVAIVPTPGGSIVTWGGSFLMRIVLMIAAIAGMQAGCLRGTEYHCTGNEQCSGGVCEPVGYCSFADLSCTGGQRFGDGAGTYSNTCVGDVPDGGVDTPAPQPDMGTGCPATYMSVAGGQGNHVYRIVAASTQWDNQVAACGADGANAYLVIPDDLAELTAISTLFMQTQTFWVGISDEATEGTFVTVRNTPATFLPWETGQPNNGGGNSNCVTADRAEHTFNDQRCNQTQRAICECEP